MRGFKWHTYGILMLAIAACGKDSSSPQIQPELSIVAGDVQIDTVGKTLPTELGAKLTDKNSGLPLPGRVINWVVLEGGGQTFVSVSQTATDGVARNIWTLGTLAGGQKLVARWLDPETGESVTLDTATAMAVPERAAWIRLTPGFSNLNPERHVGDTVPMFVGYEDRFANVGATCPGNVPWESLTWTFQNSPYEDSAIVRGIGAQRLPDGILTKFVAIRTGGVIFSVTTDCALAERTITMTYSLAVRS
jgi:hypothetical protein